MTTPRFQFRHQYDDAADERLSQDTGTGDFEESLTQQHFTEDADINVIMKRYGVTDGALTPAALDPSHFGDFSDVPDFRSALDRTREAQERFNELPAKIRERFANDPVRLWEFVSDYDNAEEAVTLGLLHKTAIEPPAPAPAPEATPKTPAPLA